MRLVVLLVLAGLLAGSASAAELRSAQLTLAMATASGQVAPDVSCETNTAAWDVEVRAVGAPPNAEIDGYTYLGRVRLAPWICQNLTPASPRFGQALYVLGVEAARLAGHGAGAEAMAGCWGLAWAVDLARRVWGITFFTRASKRVEEGALLRHRGTFPRYQTLCS